MSDETDFNEYAVISDPMCQRALTIARLASVGDTIKDENLLPPLLDAMYSIAYSISPPKGQVVVFNGGKDEHGE